MQIFRTHTVNVYRFTRSGDADSYGTTPVYQGLDCQITPASSEIVAIYGGNLSLQLFEVYFTEDAVLQTGDKLVSGSTQYIVRDAPARFETAFLSHTRVIAEVVL